MIFTRILKDLLDLQILIVTCEFRTYIAAILILGGMAMNFVKNLCQHIQLFLPIFMMKY